MVTSNSVPENSLAAPDLSPRVAAPPMSPHFPRDCATTSARRGNVVPGDRLHVRMFEKAALGGSAIADHLRQVVYFERLDLGGAYEVDENGDVGLPLVERMKVVGLSLRCVEAKVAVQFYEFGHGVLSVSVVFAARPPAMVTGAVRSPGAYPVAAGMTLGALLASAGAEATVLDVRKMQELNDRRAELEQIAAGMSLSLARMEALVANQAELSLDADDRETMLAFLGRKRLDAEADLLGVSVALALATDAATANLLAGFDARISAAEARLVEVQKQANDRAERQKAYAALLAQGVATAKRVDDHELEAMALERARLEIDASLVDLRQVRETTVQQAKLAAAERDDQQHRELVDLLEQKATVDAELDRVSARLAQLTGDLPSPEISHTLSVIVQRRTPTGTENIVGDARAQVFPGDIVIVGMPGWFSQALVDRVPMNGMASAAAKGGAVQ